MNDKKITNDQVANVIIEITGSSGYCDDDTAKGFKTSKKKEILKSSNDNSFAKFTQEIIKRQNKKDGEI